MTVSTVLVVDDDPGIRESLGDVLRAEGYQVRFAENGLIGIQDMRSVPHPDVVILDLMMPVLSGWEVLEEISEDASLRPIPVLVVSAMSAPIEPARKKGGVRMCLPKPLDIDALLDALVSLAAPAIGSDRATPTTHAGATRA